MMNWRSVLKSVQALAAHSLLFTFSLLLVLKLDHVTSSSWWIIFFPLWIFHAVVARGRFSLPAPSVPHSRHWAPCHAFVAAPLLIAFELLLCIYLESIYVHGFAAVNLKVVFLPLLAFEIIILIDNFRMCRALMPGDDESMNDEAIWETLPHFWVAISMVFFVAATIFTLLKLCGEVGALGWWDLFINFGIAECFSFLVCTKWSNPVIHRNSRTREATSSSTTIRYLDWNSGLVVSAEEDQHRDRMCGLQDIGGHLMKIPVIGFQVLLCMRLEGTPANARHIPLPVLFSPLFLLQGAGVLFSACRLVEKIVLLLRSGAGTGIYFRISSRAHDCFGFLHHGSRLLGWWSIDEGSREEHARLFHEGASGFGDFKQLLVNRQKLPNIANRSMKDFKMKRCYVGFASRERSAWSCYRVGIASFAVPAVTSVKNAQYAVLVLRSAYLCMMFRLSFTPVYIIINQAFPASRQLGKPQTPGHVSLPQPLTRVPHRKSTQTPHFYFSINREHLPAGKREDFLSPLRRGSRSQS